MGLEVSQAFPLGEPRAWRALRQRLAATLRCVLAFSAGDATNRPDEGAEYPQRNRVRGRLAVT